MNINATSSYNTAVTRVLYDVIEHGGAGIETISRQNKCSRFVGTTMTNAVDDTYLSNERLLTWKHDTRAFNVNVTGCSANVTDMEIKLEAVSPVFV